MLGRPVAAGGGGGGVWVQAGLLSEADSDAEWRLKTPPLAPHQADRPRNQAALELYNFDIDILRRLHTSDFTSNLYGGTLTNVSLTQSLVPPLSLGHYSAQTFTDRWHQV